MTTSWTTMTDLRRPVSAAGSVTSSQRSDSLGARVEIIAESARSLPTRIDLPTVRALPAARPAARPKTHGTTGATG